MSDYRIITDATADLSPELMEKLHLDIIPMQLELNGTEYVFGPKGGNITAAEFYAQMRKTPVAKTSQIPVSTYEAHFRSAFEAGEDVLCIAFSSALSGTYQASLLAAENVKEEYPERKVRCVDSRAASLGEGLLVYTAANKKAEGMGLDELADWIEKERDSFAHWFTVDDLQHLRRGGRVGAVAATFGTVLSIKPVMHVDNEGRLIPVEKVKGRKKALRALVEQMEETFLPELNDIVFIGHGDCENDALYVRDLVKEKTGMDQFLIYDIGPVIGAHTNADVVALFFRGKHK